MLPQAAISPIFQPMILAPSGNEGLFIYLFIFIYSFFNVDNYRTNTACNKKIAIKY